MLLNVVENFRKSRNRQRAQKQPARASRKGVGVIKGRKHTRPGSRSPAAPSARRREPIVSPIDGAELARQVEIATTHVIEKQVEAGVDVGNDGEQSRVGFQTYVSRCLCGFGGESRRPPSRDQIDFPSYARQTELRFPHSARVANAPAALSDVQYVDSAPINEDAARLKRMGSRFSECFMTAPSPGIVATTMLNQHYDSHEAYLTALAKALSNEYRAIHNAGMVLQIDAPDLAMERHRFFSHLGEAEFLRQLELHIGLSIWGSRAFPASASGSMSAGATVTGRMSMTLR
jgi:5-methyltetrahydropteroyltriglutamate--homocysteine methyltransferase